MNFEVGIDALDVVDYTKNIGRGLVDVKIEERGVTADIVVAIHWQA